MQRSLIEHSLRKKKRHLEFIVLNMYIINLITKFVAFSLILLQYFMPWQRESISNLMEKAIIEADQKGVKVLTLGLLNQVS